MSRQHSLLESLAAVEAVVDERAVDAEVCVHSLGAEELKQAVQVAYRVVCKMFGVFLVSLVAEARDRRLFKHKLFSGASGMTDLLVGWLACTPAFARRLLKMGKHLTTGRFAKTLTSLAHGEIDPDQANAVVDSVRWLPLEIVDQEELDKAADTMLDLARGGNDAEILKASGRWLLEHIAPEKAVEHDEKQAERTRDRAESMRGVEVTGFGVAGAKEIRFRAEAETINKFMKLIDPLTEPLDPEATGTDGLDQRSLERRRADAVVELVDHLYATDHLAELTPEQLEHLAAMLRANLARPNHADPEPHSDDNDTDDDGDGHGNNDIDDIDDRDGEQEAEDFGLTDIDDLECDGQPDLDTDPGVDPSHHDAPGDPNDPDDAEGDERDDWDEHVGGDRSADCTCDCHHDGDEHDQDDDDQNLDQDDGCDVRSEHARRHPKRRPGSRVRRGKGVWCKPCAHWRPERPKVYVRTDYDHATGRVTAAMLDTGERLSVKQVERLMCDADIVPVWMTKNMTPVAVAATQRYFRGTQLAALIARDFGCAFPGCTRGLRYVHAHHIHPYKTTGRTCVDDGVLVCSHHHRLLHEGDWTVHIAADGKPEFVPPRWVDATRTPRRHIRHQR